MHNHATHKQGPPTLRMLFWETTAACNLRCAHCRAEPAGAEAREEFSTEEAFALLEDVASFARPIIVLSGGEPMVRGDIYDIASHGTKLGLRVVLATNGTLIDPQNARRLKESGIQRVSVSLDGPDALSHDRARGVTGAFDAALSGIESCSSAGLQFQINSTVTLSNVDSLPRILDLAVGLGAVALHLFLLVPTGCGRELADSEMLSAQQYEQVLNWIYDASKQDTIHLKATCAPHYFRVMRQRSRREGLTSATGAHGMDSATKGCLAGSAVCFVSHEGEVYPCGYFPLPAGSVRTSSLEQIWERSDLFKRLRDPSLLEGKCGICEYSRVCGGCRARSYAETGNYLAEETCCVYNPRRQGC